MAPICGARLITADSAQCDPVLDFATSATSGRECQALTDEGKMRANHEPQDNPRQNPSGLAVGKAESPVGSVASRRFVEPLEGDALSARPEIPAEITSRDRVQRSPAETSESRLRLRLR